MESKTWLAVYKAVLFYTYYELDKNVYKSIQNYNLPFLLLSTIRKYSYIRK